MEIEHAVKSLAGLAQETRLAIFRLLVQAGPEGLPAGAIAEALALPPATLSFHLKTLRHAGLVDFRRLGRSLVYSADFEAMNGLLGFLTENCCGGDDAACGRVSMCAPAAVPARAGSRGGRRA